MDNLKEAKLEAFILTMFHELQQMQEMHDDEVVATIGEFKALHRDLNNRKCTAIDLDKSAQLTATAKCHHDFAEELHKFLKPKLKEFSELMA